MRPTLSIITVVLNDASGLQTTLDSIAAQELPDLEHIVIDGGSTDGTLNVIRASGRIDYWSSERDRGIYDAMNKGLQRASGQWVAFLNAGDTYVSSSALRDLRLAIQDAVAIAFPTLWKYVNGDEFIVEVDQCWHDKLAMPTTHQSIVYRTDVLRRLPFDIKYRRAGDYHQLLRLVRLGRIEYSDVPLARFCEGGISTNGPMGKIKSVLEYYEAIDDVEARTYSLPARLRWILSIFAKEIVKSLLPHKIVTRIRTATRLRKGQRQDAF